MSNDVLTVGPKIALVAGLPLAPVNFMQLFAITPDPGLIIKLTIAEQATLPASLMFSADGVLSGTPDTASVGSYNLVLTVNYDQDTGDSLLLPLTIYEAATTELTDNNGVFASISTQINAMNNSDNDDDDDDDGDTSADFAPSLESLAIGPTLDLVAGLPLTAVDFTEVFEIVPLPNRVMTLYIAGQDSLPDGLSFSVDGILSGIPRPDTVGSYKLIFTVIYDQENNASIILPLNIHASVVEGLTDNANLATSIIEQIKVLNASDPRIAASAMPPLDWRMKMSDIYYLIERYAYLTIWDYDNTGAPSKKQALHLPDASKHFVVHDFGTCVVASPAKLFSHERTKHDNLLTARAVATEVYSRKWNVQFSGTDKMVGMAWVQLELLGEQYGDKVSVNNYTPRQQDEQILHSQLANLKTNDKLYGSG